MIDEKLIQTLIEIEDMTGLSTENVIALITIRYASDYLEELKRLPRFEQ